MTPPYVALGDSYAAGIGSDTPGTQVRRDGGYPVLLAREIGMDVAYQSFMGATVDNVIARQLDPLSADTRLVTVTVGGNDAGFAPVLIACAQPAWLANGLLALRIAMGHARRVLPARLDRLYAEIRARAPGARLVVTAYPRLFAGVDCQLLTFFSTAEMTAVNAAADDLADLIAAAAQRAGAEFVDVRGAFTGHELCRPQEWIHGVSWPVDSSFHPTTRGHTAYAQALAPLAAQARPPAPTTAVARAASATVTVASARRREPRVQPGPNRRGTAERFRLPDLLAPHNLDAAQRHGLDRREVARLAARLPRGQRAAAPGAPPVDHAALARLRELDAAVRRREGRP